ncbi:MAG: sensor histidine kinase [Cellvibrionaceae bacterium]
MQTPSATDRQGQKALPPSDSVPFLPDMCALQAVFLLVLLGELLALSLTLADSGLMYFDWEDLGFRSFLIQWIVLLSAAALCPLRFWLSSRPSWLAGLLSYLLVQLITVLCSALGLWFVDGWQSSDVWGMLSNLILSAIFSGVVLRYLYVQQQWSNQQKAELNARIQALQSRIQPHFLFNSMNSIASLIAVDPDKAETMVEDLSSLFRASLAEPGLVPLADEIELCHQYMAIEGIRLGERLQTRWLASADYSEQQHRCKVPSLLLQPLLENAIVHGIQPLADGGVIDIHLSVEGGRLSITIENPMAEQATADSTRGHRIALENIRHRLQAHFGTEAKFEAQSLEDRFVVSLSYPVDY